MGEEEYKEDLSEFAAKWRLQDEAQQLLFSLPEEVQQKILLSFSPRDVERDANAIFIKFARSVSQTCQGAEEMQDFVARWSLNEESRQMLHRIDSSVRTKIMREFSPRDTSSDANNIFMRFAQGVAAKGGKGGFKGAPSAGKGKGGFGQPHQQFQHFAPAQGYSQMQYVPAAITPHYQAPMQAPGATYANAGVDLHDPVLVQFVARWNLRAEAKGLLASLSPHAQQKVIQEFSPRDASRDCNAIFMKFASGHALPRGPVAHQQQQHQQQQYHQQERHAYPAQAFPPHDAGVAAGASSGPAFDDPVLVQFVARWNLRSEAQNLLASLEPAAQQKIMQEFSPRDTSRDCNSIFMKFASGHSGQPRQQQAFHQQPRHQPQAPRLGESLPYHAHPGQEMVGQEFLERWRLGPEAQQTFHGLLPEQQERVMQEFSPRDASSDANNIFIRFCTGVARGTSSGRGKGGPPGQEMRSAPY